MGLLTLGYLQQRGHQDLLPSCRRCYLQKCILLFIQPKLAENKKSLEQKIRLMAFLEMAFNLPKSNRVVTFDTLASVCSIGKEHVEFMAMKAASLNLVNVQIDQLA